MDEPLVWGWEVQPGAMGGSRGGGKLFCCGSLKKKKRGGYVPDFRRNGDESFDGGVKKEPESETCSVCVSLWRVAADGGTLCSRD